MMIRCDVLIHGRRWVAAGMLPTGELTKKQALSYCTDAAIHADTVADGDGGNIVALGHAQQHVGFGIKDDAAAGAVIVRWVFNSVPEEDDTEEISS